MVKSHLKARDLGLGSGPGASLNLGISVNLWIVFHIYKVSGTASTYVEGVVLRGTSERQCVESMPC